MKPSRVSSATALGVLGIVAVQAIATADDVSAGNWGSAGDVGAGGTTNGVFLTNDSNWIVRGRVLTDPYVTGMMEALQQSYYPTDLTVTTYPWATSCAGDLCVYDFNYGDNGLNGWNACAGPTQGAHPNMVCSLDYVRVNLFYAPPPKRIMCHEIGHSVGLRHTQEQASCVKKTSDGGDSAVLSDHDKAHVNAHY